MLIFVKQFFNENMKFLILLVICSFVLLSCSNNENECKSCKIKDTSFSDTLQKHKDEVDSLQEKNMLETNLIDIKTINPNIFVDLKYASTDNFMKIRLYEKLEKAFLQKDVAQRLSKCQQFLETINPNYHLLIYDAVRPVSVQQKMWDALDTIPVALRTKFVSNPANGSIHNYGAAVDLTICNEKGQALDMGAGYDDIREIAYPRLEERFLASGELTSEQVENRKLLRKVMASQSFTNITTEWWHFNACPRAIAKEKYLILEEE